MYLHIQCTHYIFGTWFKINVLNYAHIFTEPIVYTTHDHMRSLWGKCHLFTSHDSLRLSTYTPDVGFSSQFEWFVRVCECLSVCWSEWLCESSLFVCLPIYKNLHSDLIWSDRIWALLWSEMIGNSLASLHGVEQPASQQTPGPPRFKLWSEVMNGSDILVFCGFGVISNVTVDNEYRGDSDLTTTKKKNYVPQRDFGRRWIILVSVVQGLVFFRSCEMIL